MQVVVTGIGLISALGSTVEQNWTRLLQGKSGIRHCQPFPELSQRPLGLICDRPSSLESLLLPATDQALKDANLTDLSSDAGVVIGSSRGFQSQWETCLKATHNLPSPDSEILKLYSHSPASSIAHQLKLTGPILSPRAACATGLWAIAQAADLIRTGQCTQVIAGAAETPITPMTIAGFTKMGAMATSGAYPFDVNREGLVLGEGAALFILESQASAEQRGAKSYGQILGFGCTADGHHRSAPDEDQRVAIAAIEQSLKRSHLSPRDIGYIHAHGTATQLNDQAEARLIQHLFPRSVAVSSTKGATGHTLGASGALGVAFSLLALQQQVAPPCVGLHKQAFDLNVITAATPINLQAALCLSFGFGGQNTAISLKRYTQTKVH